MAPRPSSEQKQKQIAIEKAEEASMAGKVGMERAAVEVTVRELDVERDLPAVEELERRCEVGLSGDQADGGKKKKKKSMSLCVEQIGDPLARVRHAPEHVMLVAECGVEMVGVVKACIKMVSRGRGIGSSSSSGSVAKQQQPATAYVKVAFILGLRVSPSHRRLGIATALVKAAEEWSRKRGAAHATMATTESNKASLALFTGRFGYKQFRRPVLLGRPVHARWLPVTSRHRVLQLPPTLAAAAYARLLPPQDTEFLPADLPALLAHKLTLGTFVAIESSDGHTAAAGAPSPSFAVLSVWDQTRSLRLRVDGAPALLRHSLAAVRALDRAAPWLRVPSVPDIFRPFGAYLIYGVRMSGPEGPALLRTLCSHAHNMARNNPACGVVAADLSPDDPAAAAIPSWRRFSCDEDVWCIKNLSDSNAASSSSDWPASAPPGSVLFVDPREF
ncbi:acetyl transferase GW6a [Aegilops tauschii subsp. strangulata]|nr:LOW QUALITY PROTEIN: probable N-acetyltransferase HLS1 [Aegilops tauschii subsp. strangulata]